MRVQVCIVAEVEPERLATNATQEGFVPVLRGTQVRTTDVHAQTLGVQEALVAVRTVVRVGGVRALVAM